MISTTGPKRSPAPPQLPDGQLRIKLLRGMVLFDRWFSEGAVLTLPLEQATRLCQFGVAFPLEAHR